MKPTRVIHERKQSAPAACPQWVYTDEGPRSYVRCGMHLRMMVTKSPLGGLPYEELIVLRCPWHIQSGHGVVPEEQHRVDEWGDRHVW